MPETVTVGAESDTGNERPESVATKVIGAGSRSWRAIHTNSSTPSSATAGCDRVGRADRRLRVPSVHRGFLHLVARDRAGGAVVAPPHPRGRGGIGGAQRVEQLGGRRAHPRRELGAVGRAGRRPGSRARRRRPRARRSPRTVARDRDATRGRAAPSRDNRARDGRARRRRAPTRTLALALDPGLVLDAHRDLRVPDDQRGGATAAASREPTAKHVRAHARDPLEAKRRSR